MLLYDIIISIDKQNLLTLDISYQKYEYINQESSTLFLANAQL